MSSDGNSTAWGAQNDPFGDDFFLVPPEQELRARAVQMRQDNRDALRHHIELLVWGVQANTDLLGVFVSVLMHWKEIDPTWVADAACMSVGDVSRLAESEAMMDFNCLDCRVELPTVSRRQRIRMNNSLEALCGRGPEDHHLRDLLCKPCTKQRDDHDEAQRLLDDLRQRALLDEYRKRPYAERRESKEWAILKNQVLRRDRYRCRLCGEGDVVLHVHHATYKNYAAERLEDLITLCSVCHDRFHFGSAESEAS